MYKLEFDAKCERGKNEDFFDSVMDRKIRI